MYIKIYQTYRIDADNWVYQFSYRRYRAAINRVGVPLKTVRDTTQSRSKSLAVRCSYRGDLSPLCRREEGAAAKYFWVEGGELRRYLLFAVMIWPPRFVKEERELFVAFRYVESIGLWPVRCCLVRYCRVS